MDAKKKQEDNYSTNECPHQHAAWATSARPLSNITLNVFQDVPRGSMISPESLLHPHAPSSSHKKKVFEKSQEASHLNVCTQHNFPPGASVPSLLNAYPFFFTKSNKCLNTSTIPAAPTVP